ncbi:M48 family metalloprotease [Wenzhouxiangella sp. XN201]|uniref:M48 family metalloprotease n=1 Tax=Wenzhouxiangella sp. XN201 TaxID=2710755 RepID=UPI0013C621C2|nr:M48 family metalloprotease [Wenzhouxiangella sp. XN201]NEZ05020.1 M48 family metalloprotease [Wenzhouxiangella sp. XN201]
MKTPFSQTPPVLVALAAAFMLLQGCAVNPVSGDREFVLVSEDQEIAMGAQGAESVRQSIGLVDDAALQNYVQALGMTMAVDSERPELPWSFGVIDDPTPNAFAFPGGYIFVTRGLMGLMGNEAELASVLGHEIGHVTARHSVAMITRSQVAQIGLGVGSILSPEIAEFSEAAASGLQLLFLSYGRDAERQADDLGFGYALDNGYDVREMPNVFASLQDASQLAGASPMPNWLASHPAPAERIQRIEKRLDNLDQPLGGTRVGEDEYVGRIDGMVFGVNPRQGYFEENRFMHPELEFRITFPQGWQTQNLAQVVLAGSPDQDAVVQLTLAAGSPSEAAEEFFAQEGLASSNVDSRSINGLSAVSGRFQAQTANGELGGRAAFIAHENRVYRLLAYTPADKFSRYESAFQQTIGSFARLTDRRALAKQPERISIVRTPRAMTLDEFDAQYPSVIDMERLVLINQLSGPNVTIPAGTPVKRVVQAR